VVSPDGGVVAAVSIVAHSSVDVDRLAYAMRTAASGISRQTVMALTVPFVMAGPGSPGS
jgi:hypothetical protein